MIRCIQRRLIIPRGDTGSFTIPVLGTMDATDVAIFSIFDQRTRKILFSKQAVLEEEVLKIIFTHLDTINLKPGKYVWDIKIYKNPQYIDDIIIGGDEINSYYAGFSLPVCEIKETAELYLCGCKDNDFSEKLNLINATLNEVREIAARAENSVKHYPIIQNNYWYIWDPEKEGYINTRIKANGDDNVTSIDVIDENTLKVTFSNGSSQNIPISGIGALVPEDEIIYDAGSIDPDDDLIYDGGCIDDNDNLIKDLILDAGSLEGGD